MQKNNCYCNAIICTDKMYPTTTDNGKVDQEDANLLGTLTDPKI